MDNYLDYWRHGDEYESGRGSGDGYGDTVYGDGFGNGFGTGTRDGGGYDNGGYSDPLDENIRELNNG
jgi:hypothetical protein